MKKIIRHKRIISVGLIISLTFGIINYSGICKRKVEAAEQVEKVDLYDINTEEKLSEYIVKKGVITEKGMEYNTLFCENDEKRYVQMINFDETIRKDIIYDRKSNNIEISEYEIICDNDEKSYKEVSKLVVNYDDLICGINVNNTRYTWKDRVSDHFKYDLWYQWGKSGYGNKYLKIGRKATYSIPYYKLNKSEKLNCDSYISHIDTSNSYLVGIRNDVLLAFITGGISSVIGLIGAIANASSMIEDLKSAKKHYEKAAVLYDQIKKYGEKE